MTDLGLNTGQVAYADTIIGVGQSRHASTKDIQTAVMVALAESSLQNLASVNVPESLNIPHDGVGSDSDSVGLFQQRPSQGWGTVAELMDPKTAATKFYDALDKVPNRDGSPAWINAQKVQRSFDPTGTNYMVHYMQAVALVQSAGTVGTPGGQAGAAVAGSVQSFQNAVSWISAPANWQRIGIFALGALLLGLAAWRLLEASGGLTAAAKVGKVFIP